MEFNFFKTKDEKSLNKNKTVTKSSIAKEITYTTFTNGFINKESFIQDYKLVAFTTILKSITSEVLNNINIVGLKYNPAIIIDSFVCAFLQTQTKQYIYKNGNTLIAISDSVDNKDKNKFEEKEISLNNEAFVNAVFLILESYAGLLVANYNQVVLSDVLLMKIDGLRLNQLNTSEDINNLDKEIKAIIDPINQNKAKTLLIDGKDIVEYLGSGNSQVLIDAKDVLNNNLAMLFNLPLSFFTGEFKSSLGSSNSSDIDYRDKGLINFYNSYVSIYLEQLGFTDIKRTYHIEALFKKQSTKDFLLFLETTSLIDDSKKKELLNQFLISNNIKI